MLILASSSKYRQKLLSRFGLAFDCHAPAIDESARPNESPLDLVGRLATEKAATISRKYPQAIVIGSDQLAVYDGRIVGKPGTHEAAQAQLLEFGGNKVEFLTAVSVQSQHDGFCDQFIDTTSVYFRPLQPDEIDRYLLAEQPYDCAGAFKAEALGITLFERIRSDDPSALIGLPLIRTASLLRRAGLQIP